MTRQIPSLENDRCVLPGASAWEVLLALPDAVLAVSAEGAVQLLNRAAERLLRIDADAAAGRHWSQLLRLRELPRDGCSLGLLPAPDPAGEQASPTYYKLICGDGAQRIVRIADIDTSAMAVAWAGRVLLLYDCTLVYERLQQLERECAHDHLTKLLNRREFERRLEVVIRRAQEDGSRHVLLFMDLDRFKQINDTHGHAAGDTVLRDIAAVLRGSLRERDALGRLGGDEFGLLLEHCRPEDGVQAAGKLCQLLRRQRFCWRGKPLNFGISIGVAAIGRDSGGVESILARADAACYCAKRRGYGGIAVH